MVTFDFFIKLNLNLLCGIETLFEGCFNHDIGRKRNLSERSCYLCQFTIISLSGDHSSPISSSYPPEKIMQQVASQVRNLLSCYVSPRSNPSIFLYKRKTSCVKTSHDDIVEGRMLGKAGDKMNGGVPV